MNKEASDSLVETERDVFDTVTGVLRDAPHIKVKGDTLKSLPAPGCWGQGFNQGVDPPPFLMHYRGRGERKEVEK